MFGSLELSFIQVKKEERSASFKLEKRIGFSTVFRLFFPATYIIICREEKKGVGRNEPSITIEVSRYNYACKYLKFIECMRGPLKMLEDQVKGLLHWFIALQRQAKGPKPLY